jgi:hypothetical protein
MPLRATRTKAQQNTAGDPTKKLILIELKKNYGMFILAWFNWNIKYVYIWAEMISSSADFEKKLNNFKTNMHLNKINSIHKTVHEM